MAKPYDLVVVGTGTAAMGIVGPVREAGWSVAVVDFRPYGGTCALRGCDPKKMLVTGAEAIDLASRMHPNGVAGETHIDWPPLMAFKRRFTDPIPAGTEDHLKKNGIDTLHGRARFIGSSSMEVDGKAIEGRHFVLAAGAEPVKLGIPGEQHIVTNEEFLALEHLPQRLLLAGGGYIAAQFEADLVVHAAGREPDLADLNPPAANVALTNGKLELNDYLQSVSNPAFCAAGDAAEKGPPLTPVSAHDAEVVTENLLQGNREAPWLNAGGRLARRPAALRALPGRPRPL